MNGLLRVCVVAAVLPRVVNEYSLELPTGSTADDALAACDAVQSFAPELQNQLTRSIWGRTVRGDHALIDADRIELTRALRVDPKVARRERFAQQGSKGAGLFAKTRPGGKAGY